tara:strand:+ start:192 stop:431 length:240 start_codon:yes stop_codon:yes gene_type:complete
MSHGINKNSEAIKRISGPNSTITQKIAVAHDANMTAIAAKAYRIIGMLIPNKNNPNPSKTNPITVPTDNPINPNQAGII